jgi:hypothetical protein
MFSGQQVFMLLNRKKGEYRWVPKAVPLPNKRHLYPASLISVTVAVVSSPVTVSPVVGPIVILVTVWGPVIVSVPVVPVAVVAPAMMSVIAQRVPVAMMATYSKTEGEMS